MGLVSNERHDIEQFVGEETTRPPFFPPFTIATKPSGPRGTRFRGIFITDTNKPAWQDANGVWRYADGTTV